MLSRGGANAFWQIDFSDFEATADSAWRIHRRRRRWPKLCLAPHVNGTYTARDAVCAMRRRGLRNALRSGEETSGQCYQVSVPFSAT
jgi:hypothetical protein